jgi:hypothetical protein
MNRNKLNLEKTHFNDAFIISGGNLQKRSKLIVIIQKHRNNRHLGVQRKGFPLASRKQRYKIQPKDLVLINRKWFFTNGSHSKGKAVIIDKKSISISKIKRYYNFGSMVYTSL